MIESAPEVVDCVPDDEAELGEDRFGFHHALNAKDVVAGLRIYLGVDR